MHPTFASCLSKTNNVAERALDDQHLSSIDDTIFVANSPGL